jgi:predicted SprT family Zn-dependent metalloprotease
MRIPKRFRLMGQVIEVTRRESDFIESSDRVAFASYRTNEIQLNPMMSYKSASQDEHAFLHELMHFIFFYSGAACKGKTKWIHQDEDFVDLSANLLHQALTTMEYDETEIGA